MLCTCSAFVYLGTEGLTENVPAGKLSALDLSGTVHILTGLCCVCVDHEWDMSNYKCGPTVEAAPLRVPHSLAIEHIA